LFARWRIGAEMDTCGLAAAALMLLVATASCATHTGEDKDWAAWSEQEFPLDLAIDHVDIAHGALRLRATMVGGAADVAVTLGDACERRGVGGGISTPSTLVWALRQNDLADALGCGLVVRAHVRTQTGYVTKAASLSVAPFVVASSSQGSEDTERAEQSQEGSQEGPRLQEISSTSAGVSILFASVSPRAHLLAGDSLIGPTLSDDEDPSDDTRRFDVPHDDFARSVIMRRPLVLDGASFETSLSVGGTVLED
jgi:hypothetical protein